jgi:hypothetical protein
MSKIEKYIPKFILNYKSNIESIVKNALLLKEARKELNDSEWNNLQKKLKLTYRVTQVITRIGKSKILTNEKYYKLVPPNLYTVYELTRLSENRLIELLQSGKINSNTSRIEIHNVLGISYEDTTPKKENTIRFLNLRLNTKNFSLKHLNDIKKELQTIISKYKDKVETNLEDFKLEERFLRDKKRTLLLLESHLKSEKLHSEKKNYKKIFDMYKERLENLGKDTLEEGKKVYNNYS